MAVNERAAMTEDEQRLHEMGYAQELRRRMSGFSNFAVSFTIISILSGCLTLYGFGMNVGGPVVMTWGWPFVGVMTLFVGLAMAEVCSSYPTAGGLYYWSAKLARKNGPAWSWFTGWFNFLGQVAVTAGIDFGAAFFINAWLNLVFGTPLYHWVTILIFAAVLLVHGIMNQRSSSPRRTTSRPTSSSRASSTTRAGTARSTWCCSACCSPSTPSPATTPPRT